MVVNVLLLGAVDQLDHGLESFAVLRLFSLRSGAENSTEHHA